MTTLRLPTRRLGWALILTFVVALVGLFLGSQLTLAQTRKADTIVACVRDGVGLVKIVEKGESCPTNWTLTNWNIQGPSGPLGPKGAAGDRGPWGPKAMKAIKGLPGLSRGLYSTNSGSYTGTSTASPASRLTDRSVQWGLSSVALTLGQRLSAFLLSPTRWILAQNTESF